MARLLDRDEREAVLGDLVEAQARPLDALIGVIGLITRRHALLWKSWRPWLAGFGVALPNSSLLMGVSLSVTWSYMRLFCPELLAQASLSKPSAFSVLLWQAFLLIGWSWTGGFVVGAVSRQTLWASTLLCYSPCLFCLTRFQVGSLPRFSVLLFVLPAIWGVHRGLRIYRMKLSSALIVALGITVMMIPGWNNGAWYWWSPQRWVLNWVLSFPAWYLVATAQTPTWLKVRTNGLDCTVKGAKMANELTLSVNGAKQSINVGPDTPLLFVLRNELKLTGPRMGCGMAQCGACAVLLDGEEIRTCITPVSYAVGKQVTTIEGLPAVWAAQKGLSAADARTALHPVQQAWIDEQVPQCGYCQSGMMIAAVQLLSKNPNPTVAQIKDAFTNTPPSPHLCRCGTYAAIIDAVQRAAKAMKAEAR